MFGNLSEEGIEQVLESQLLGHIGCHSKDKTYIVPMCYAYDENCIYARTFEGIKLTMMRNNPRVCFQVEHLENMGNWQSVVCWGQFEELTDVDKRNKGIDVLQKRVSAMMGDENLRVSHHWPFSLDDSGDIQGIIFCIHISERTGKFENISIKKDYS